MDQIFVWQELSSEDNRWGTIGTYVPAMGAITLLQGRSEEVAWKLEPLATAHARSAGNPIRLAQYNLAKVITRE
jgi:hypothetical protein